MNEIPDFNIDDELAAFDAAMARLGKELVALPEDSPQWAVITAEVEIRIARMQSIIDKNRDDKFRWLIHGEIDEE